MARRRACPSGRYRIATLHDLPLKASAVLSDFGTLFGDSGTLFGDFGTLFGDFGTFIGDFGTFIGDFGTFIRDFGTFIGDSGTLIGDSETFPANPRPVHAIQKRFEAIPSGDLRLLTVNKVRL